jgi:N-acetylmuramoyl-L-alanine amidase
MKNLLAIITVLFTSFVMLHAAGADSGCVIIDPGHSPKAPGATSCTGKPEYLYNAALAEAVAANLSAYHIPVAVTRRAQEELSLSNRARSASGKCLFLSIHHDSVQPQFITWENSRPISTKAEGYSIFISRKNRYYAQSLNYARKLGVALRSRGLRPSLHHAEKIAGENRQLLDPELGIYRYDDLVVLKKAEAPAILLEAAVLVHPQDEERAASAAYQRQIADAVADMMNQIK